MAGLGSVCSHVSALLFKVEAVVYHKLNQPVDCTSQLCASRSCKKHVNPAPIKAICFKRGNKHDLPSVTNSKLVASDHFSTRDPTAGVNSISKDKFKELQKLNSKAAVFTSIWEEDMDDNENMHEALSSDTDSDCENETNFLPEPLIALYDHNAKNLDKEDLEKLLTQLYSEYEDSYPQKAYDHLREETKNQASPENWILHRTGIITASVCHQVYKTKLEKPSKSLINSIMQYNSQCDNKYTKYGRNMEPVARQYYKKTMMEKHSNLVVCETGLNVKAICPFLGASPDGIVSCSCHTERLLEIKCPFKYRDSISGWEQDKDFPIDENMEMKPNHRYYYQAQLQMFVCSKTI